ncbi:hypothetical protein ACFX13_034831 [Malus domestica]
MLPTSSALTTSIPSFDHSVFRAFSATHGLGIHTISIQVENVVSSFTTSVAYGAKPSAAPILLDNCVTIAKVQLVLHQRFHWIPRVPRVHREDIGTSKSELNSVVLANNKEMVLFSMNKPMYRTKRKSQIQTYLEHNEGAGVQHLAFVSEDIFRTLREMRSQSSVGGFQFMQAPPLTSFGHGSVPHNLGDLYDVIKGDVVAVLEEVVIRVGGAVIGGIGMEGE